MNTTYQQRKEIEELERRLKAKQESLAQTERACQHLWGEIKADHIYREGYTIPGDPVGTMGIDWRGPCYVPPQTTNRWSRTCSRCGKIEYTSRTIQEVKNIPAF